MPDFIVRKKDRLPAYQIVSLADDIHYGITYIIMGYDLVSSTAAQIYLAQLVGKHKFTTTSFFRCPLIESNTDHKLFKSAGDTYVKVLLHTDTGKMSLQK